MCVCVYVYMMLTFVQPNAIVLKERTSVAVLVIQAVHNLSTTHVRCQMQLENAESTRSS